MATWPNVVSALGGCIEIGGFWLLARELWNSNTSALVETAELRAEKVDFKSLSISDGAKAGGSFEGGVIGKLICNLNRRQAELSASKKLIVNGLKLTGFGIVVQTIGSICQAVWPN
jgi:hypothetical protein